MLGTGSLYAGYLYECFTNPIYLSLKKFESTNGNEDFNQIRSYYKYKKDAFKVYGGTNDIDYVLTAPNRGYVFAYSTFVLFGLGPYVRNDLIKRTGFAYINPEFKQ